MTYDEMLHLPYPYRTDRPRMDRAGRAAQFSPFAALTGFDGVVQETARLTEEKPELSEEQQAAIDRTLCRLLRGMAEKPEAEVVFFQPDARKTGGRLVRKRGRVRRMDEANRMLCFADGEKVAVDAIVRAEICAKSD